MTTTSKIIYLIESVLYSAVPIALSLIFDINLSDYNKSSYVAMFLYCAVIGPILSYQMSSSNGVNIASRNFILLVYFITIGISLVSTDLISYCVIFIISYFRDYVRLVRSYLTMFLPSVLIGLVVYYYNYMVFLFALVLVFLLLITNSKQTKIDIVAALSNLPHSIMSGVTSYLLSYFLVLNNSDYLFNIMIRIISLIDFVYNSFVSLFISSRGRTSKQDVLAEISKVERPLSYLFTFFSSLALILSIIIFNNQLYLSLLFRTVKYITGFKFNILFLVGDNDFINKIAFFHLLLLPLAFFIDQAVYWVVLLSCFYNVVGYIRIRKLYTQD